MAKRKPKANIDEPTDIIEETPKVEGGETPTPEGEPEVPAVDGVPGSEPSTPTDDEPEVPAVDTTPIQEPTPPIIDGGEEEGDKAAGDITPTELIVDMTKDQEIQDDLADILASEEPDTVKAMSMPDVTKLLNDPELSITQKLGIISTDGVMDFKMLAANILSYHEFTTNETAHISGAHIAGKNYNLYSAIKQVIETEDNDIFEVKMRMLTSAFIEFKDSSLNEFSLNRYDHNWSWGDKSMKTYQHLVLLFSSLSNLATRKNELKKIDLDAMLDTGIIDINTESCDRLKRYFS